MKSRKLIKKLRHLLNADERKQIAKRDSIKKLLKKLRKRRDALEKAIDNAPNKSERQRAKEELEILNVQRNKGVALLRELKE